VLPVVSSGSEAPGDSVLEDFAASGNSATLDDPAALGDLAVPDDKTDPSPAGASNTHANTPAPGDSSAATHDSAVSGEAAVLDDKADPGLADTSNAPALRDSAVMDPRSAVGTGRSLGSDNAPPVGACSAASGATRKRDRWIHHQETQGVDVRGDSAV